MLLFIAILSHLLLASGLSLLDDYELGNRVSNRSAVQDSSPLSVAVIGAGLAGASVAFHAYEELYPHSRLQITIYEREPRFGGRIHTIEPQTEFSASLELGATTFSTDDQCLMQTLRAVGLQDTVSAGLFHVPAHTRWTHVPSQNQVTCDVLGLSWSQLAKRLWRYGVSAWRFRNEVISTLEKWRRFTIYRHFDTVQKGMDDLDLLPLISGNARDYLDSVNISREFQEEIVRPCVRVRLGRGLEDVHGLPALIAAGSSSTTMVDGGNIRLVERMIKLSGAHLSLSSEVIAIGRGQERRYRLTVRHSSEDSKEIEYVEYDSVVLAAPLRLLKIDLSGLSLSPNTASTATTHPIEAHITHFISQFRFDANFSNPSLKISITNDDILTSSSPPGAVNILKVQASEVTYNPGCPPDNICDCYGCESLYRIHSHRALDDAELVRLLGMEYNEALSLILLWVRRDVWPKAFLPYRNGSDFVGDMELARHLYYTGGGEEMMSSMEMSCRMGERVAAGLAFGLQSGLEL
ncbi:hypothetical protein KC343_g11817 [Hortaea werneckii]|nr:hypothetical protein KC352_g25973 [Hortaea werneckii]KAI7550575.1 hypothetical protein KC317_g14230 [Hortaea werneckii]KAI7603900.1 hypothetical protein KC346_g11686 [Hortaea werneckii]KAI7610758.1 hypothetical protein KC343_g11817 [Hortaea werneckii]KAI7645874.1 hypothetical protein KC319_g11922 [Hortaea werneckii]